MNNIVLSIKNLNKAFTLHNLNKRISAVENVSFDVCEGEFIGITGKSGSGKSTVLKSIYRTYRPQSGKIIYNSTEFGEIDLLQANEQQIIALRKHEIGYVSQFLNVIPRTNAKEILIKSAVETGIGPQESVIKAENILNHFEIDKTLWNNYPITFSGGEKLRLNIAQAMIKEPRLLLLDEPTASLDIESKTRVKELIEKLKNLNTTMIGIFHDIEFMRDLCDKELIMSEKTLKETAKVYC
jgi:alpha-D-ribose 1-methylphosphonate 5-triphosphate synthase subunit PhnL